MIISTDPQRAYYKNSKLFLLEISSQPEIQETSLT